MVIAITMERPKPIIMEKLTQQPKKQYHNGLYTAEELSELLTKSEEDIRAGRTYTEKQVREMIRERYDI